MKKETKQKIWKWNIETIQMFSMLNLPAWTLATDLMSKISLWTNEWHSPIYRIIYMRWLIINVWRRHLSYYSWRKQSEQSEQSEQWSFHLKFTWHNVINVKSVKSSNCICNILLFIIDWATGMYSFSQIVLVSHDLIVQLFSSCEVWGFLTHTTFGLAMNQHVYSNLCNSERGDSLFKTIGWNQIHLSFRLTNALVCVSKVNRHCEALGSLMRNIIWHI